MTRNNKMAVAASCATFKKNEEIKDPGLRAQVDILEE
jgi:hypothetical protein